MSNSTFFKLGNGNFVLHGYEIENREYYILGVVVKNTEW